MTCDTIGGAVTMQGRAKAQPGIGEGTQMDKSIGDDPTMPGGGRGSSALGRIDKYEIVRALGEGGFGAVYLAHDTVAKTDVAIKGLPPEVKHNAVELESIRQNFALVKRLRHPNIVAVTDLHQALSVSYASKEVESKLRVFERDTMVVMDYAPGVTLSQWRRRFSGGKVPLDKAIAVVRQVASALDYAHAQKVLHRDVKPANVMVESADGGKLVARVLDFGLAAEIRSSMGRLSREIRDTSGTRPYMAPEQWKGERQGSATDQYALAAMFYELVVGDVPFASVFDCGDPAVMRIAVTTDAPAIPDELPKCVRRALAVALAKKPEDRFASCGEFAAALEGKRVPHRGARTSGAGKVLVVLALFAAIGVGGLVYRQNRERQRVEQARLEAESAAAAKAVAEKIEAKRRAEEARKIKEAQKLEDARRKLDEEKRAIEEEKARMEKERARPKNDSNLEDAGISIAEQEARRKEIAELAENRVDIAIKIENIADVMAKIAAYRNEPDGFATHIANADAQCKIADGVGRSPATSAEAKAALKTLEDAERVIQREYNWLKTNKAARDGAKAIEAEIARGIVPDLERFKAGDCASVTYAKGDRLRKDGNAALAKGDFPTAKAKLSEAKKQLSDAAEEAKRFCVNTHLKAAKKWSDASKWQQCVEECDTILGWDAANAEAKELKAQAESHLVPTAKVVVKVNGEELKDGETVKIGSTEWKTPVVWGANIITEGSRYGGEVAYEKNGRRYFGRIDDFTVNWRGPRTITVVLKEYTGQREVQLWENGPYWADRNIGAENPEDYGLYFWWGDTTGHRPSGEAFDFDFSRRNPVIYTFGKSVEELQSTGWVTGSGVLAPAHDAAHVHWGGVWRMPTSDEIRALVNNCTTTWTTQNGVYGRLVTGKGAYADRSIFLPAAGDGYGSSLSYPGSLGYYWSSTPDSVISGRAWCLDFNSSYFRRYGSSHCRGQSVRPVRGFADADATNASAKSQFNLATKESAQRARVERVDDADAFKEKAERNLVPSLTIVAKVGESIADGAKVRIDGAENNTPFEWKNLTKGTRMGPYNVSYESGGKLYYGTFDAVTVDWTGPREISVAMKEYTGPRKVQLWENGPYWADRNIGAKQPEDYGYYFWWGDTVGYKRVGDAWVASDRSSSNFLFEKNNTPTMDKNVSSLMSERWITAYSVLALAPEHDAAHVHWGGDWRMPTQQEIEDLNSKCVWERKTVNGVKGYEVRGKGAYASESIFLPCAGDGTGASLGLDGSDGYYWSSVPDSDDYDAWSLYFKSGSHGTSSYYRRSGQSVRPVQGFTK